MPYLMTFALTAFVLAMLPGPGQAVMTRQVLDHGRRPAFWSTLGTGTGLIGWSLIPALGLSAALLAHPSLLTALRLAGAALLVGLGIRTVLQRKASHQNMHGVTRGAPSSASAYLTGLSTNLANPKAAIFAVVLVPQFVPAHANPTLATLSLGTVWSLVTMTWYVLFVVGVAKFAALLSTPRARNRLSVGSGLALVGIGTAVALGF